MAPVGRMLLTLAPVRMHPVTSRFRENRRLFGLNCSKPSAGKKVAVSTSDPRALYDRMASMTRFLLALLLIAFSSPAQVPAFRDLFNGKDLTGWVNVNTDEDTWSVRDGVLVCKGKPIGVMRSDKQYENFVLHIEWKHIEPGGNSGVFVWSDSKPGEKNRLPNGVEVQMLEIDFVKMHKRNGEPLSLGYVHGDLFGVGGVEITPDNPRGPRSSSLENRAKGRGEWNTYDVVAVDGVIKLSVNGKMVNGISRSTQKKGYLCLESEGAEIHFRNIKIMELPPGVTTPEQTAPEIKDN